MPAPSDGPTDDLRLQVELSEAAVRRAPEPLDLVQGLVNTLNRVRGYDLLGQLPVARWWLGRVAIDLDPSDLSDLDLAQLVELREGLRGLLRGTAGGASIEESSLAALRHAGALYPLKVTFHTSGDVGVAPAATAASSSPTTMAARVLAALPAAAAHQMLGRLKVCANPDCEWAFFDTSRSRSGTWCSMSLCGARHKMTRYRDRSSQARIVEHKG